MFENTHLAEMKTQQKELKKQSAECEKNIQKLKNEKKQLIAEKKRPLLEMPLSKDVLEELNALSSTDPDIINLTERINSQAEKKQECAEQEFAIATKIARLLCE